MKFTKYNFLYLSVVVAVICSLSITTVLAASGNIKDVTREAALSAGSSEGTWSVYPEDTNGETYYEGLTPRESFGSSYAKEIYDTFSEYWSQATLGAYVPLRQDIFMQTVKKATRNRASMSEEQVSEIIEILDEISIKVKLIDSALVPIILEDIEDFKNWTPKDKNLLAQRYSDVNTNDWFYDTVMRMTEEGLFAGKGPVVSGVGTFAPYDVMTRAEFNAVIARILFGESANTSVEGKPWWYSSDSILRGRSLIRTNDFTDSVEVPMTREEMAYMCSNVYIWGKINNSPISDNPAVFANTDGAVDKIPDYKVIKEGGYLDSVVTCYSLGIICGVDSNGTFNPKGYLTRAEATSVLYRLIHREARTPVDLSVKLEVGVSDPNAPITIYEGRLRANRFAKEGDTVIKEDGTQIVLVMGSHGILGEGQPVAADLGMQTDITKEYTIVRDGNEYGKYGGYGEYRDRTGHPIGSQEYFINRITGEGHWYYEWQAMCTEPQYKGTFDYQLSADKNFIWDADWDEWTEMYRHPVSKESIEMILSLNGIK